MLTDENVTWQELGSCSGMAQSALESGEEYSDLFFDEYENDPVMAEQADNLCVTCPVAKQCGAFGRSTKSWGVWGGVYLKEGRVEASRNAHKSDEMWSRLRAIHAWL